MNERNNEDEGRKAKAVTRRNSEAEGTKAEAVRRRNSAEAVSRRNSACWKDLREIWKAPAVSSMEIISFEDKIRAIWLHKDMEYIFYYWRRFYGKKILYLWK